MYGPRSFLSRAHLFVIGLVCLGACSKAMLTDGSVPSSCNFPLPHRCDICSTGETVCAHYVVRDGVCTAETCPLVPPVSDASTPLLDARPELGPIPVVPNFTCGPPDAGLLCSCGLDGNLPVHDAGPPQTVLPADPATVVAYHTMDEFDALAVGRWQRTAGMAELDCESFGVEFTADHQLIPLVTASDGSVQGATRFATSFSITFDAAGAPMWFQVPGLSTNPPVFFDGGRSMYFLYAPWPADYARAP